MRGFHSVFQVKVLRTFIQKCTPRILKLYQITVKNIFPIKDHIISCNGGRSLLNKGPFAGVCTDIEDILRHPSRLSVASSIHGYLALFSKHHQIIIQAGLKGAKRGEKDARAFRRRAPGEMEKILVLFSVNIISCLRNSDWVSNYQSTSCLQRQFITALLLLVYT